MVVADGILAAKPPRMIRTVVDRWAGSIPFVNVFYARVGQVIGSRDNVREMLGANQLVLIFPEGMAGIRKRAADRYVLQPFHLGFVRGRCAMRRSSRSRSSVRTTGADPVDARPLAKLLGLPFSRSPRLSCRSGRRFLPYPALRDCPRRAVPFPRGVSRRDRR
jgi:hypothetical protein